jgi:hypothetical protein
LFKCLYLSVLESTNTAQYIKNKQIETGSKRRRFAYWVFKI